MSDYEGQNDTIVSKISSFIVYLFKWCYLIGSLILNYIYQNSTIITYIILISVYYNQPSYLNMMYPLIVFGFATLMNQRQLSPLRFSPNHNFVKARLMRLLPSYFIPCLASPKAGTAEAGINALSSGLGAITTGRVEASSSKHTSTNKKNKSAVMVASFLHPFVQNIPLLVWQIFIFLASLNVMISFLFQSPLVCRPLTSELGTESLVFYPNCPLILGSTQAECLSIVDGICTVSYTSYSQSSILRKIYVSGSNDIQVRRVAGYGIKFEFIRLMLPEIILILTISVFYLPILRSIGKFRTFICINIVQNGIYNNLSRV
jgi:hypothetical protein